jgi:hypothetical protein
MIIKQQEELVAQTFAKHLRQILRPISYFENDWDPRNENSFHNEIGSHNPPPSLGPRPHRAVPLKGSFDAENLDWTMMTAVELVDRIRRQLLELTYLKNAAEKESLAVSNLTFKFTLLTVPS